MVFQVERATRIRKRFLIFRRNVMTKIKRAQENDVTESLMSVILKAAEVPSTEYFLQQGWVLTAFQNALWQLLYAPSLEKGIVDTESMRGGDVDTNTGLSAGLFWGLCMG